MVQYNYRLRLLPPKTGDVTVPPIQHTIDTTVVRTVTNALLTPVSVCTKLVGCAPPPRLPVDRQPMLPKP